MSDTMNETHVALGGDTTISCTVNGQAVSVEVPVRTSLSDMLRSALELTGTHLGCEHGVCGACTIVLDGAAVRSCLMLAVQADGTEIRTIEGLATDGTWHPIQQAMHDHHGFQCAFCSPGFMMTAVAMLEDDPNRTEAEIREELGGNLCRCTGYESIIDGVLGAIAEMRDGDGGVA